MGTDNWGELLLFSGAAGAVASSVKTAVHEVLVRFFHSQHLYFKVNAFLVHGHSRVSGIVDYLFAILGDLILGAFFGFVLSLLLRRVRPRYHYWLGIGASLGIWYGSLAFGNLTKILKAPDTDHKSLLILLVGTLVYGLFFVFLSKWWKPLRARIEK